MNTSAYVFLLVMSLGATFGNIFRYKYYQDQKSVYYATGACCAAIGITILCIFKAQILAAVMLTVAGTIGIRCLLTTLIEKTIERTRKSGPVAIALSLVPVVLLIALALILARGYGQESLGFILAVTAGIWGAATLWSAVFLALDDS
ncbi:MAG: hypothetical protein HUJ26_15510 [Planctomycetaceae bacterium]|nr:hypothetical protein [Planctomycetaceae bacterium]